MNGIQLKKTFDEELEEKFLIGWRTKCFTEIPVDDLRHYDVEIEFNNKKEFVNEWILLKQNKIKGEWLISGKVNDEFVIRPLMLIQKNANMSDLTKYLGDKEFDRFNYIKKLCSLEEAKILIGKQFGFKQCDVGVRLDIGFSTTLKELNK